MRAEINRDQLNDVQLMVKGIAVNGPKVLSRSLNKTAAKARTVSSKKIREQVNLKAGFVNERLKIDKANWGSLKARLSAKRRGLLIGNYLHGVTGRTAKGNNRYGKLIDYNAKKKMYSVGDLSQPLKLKIKPRGGAKAVPKDWFILPKLKGVNIPALAKREGNKLKVIYAPSISQVFSDVRDDIDDDMSGYLLDVTEREISAVMRGY